MSTLKADYVQSTNPSNPVDIGGTFSPTFNGNKILCGFTGSATTSSGTPNFTISNAAITTNSKVFFQASNSAAATFLNAKNLVIVSKAAGSFIAGTSDSSNFAGTETFDYFVVQPPV